MLSITIHSYRGGTGKTLLATNLAASYARKEKVCLLDYDLRAPSIHKTFQVSKSDYWVNDFLNGECGIKDVIVKVSPNLYVGFACAEVDSIRDILGKTRSWEKEALNRTISIKETLKAEKFDKIIFDTAPGLFYSSINAVVASDITALVLRLENLDISGIREMLKGVYELLEKPRFLIANMVQKEQLEAFGSIMAKTFGPQTLAHIPCYCEVRSQIAKGSDILIEQKLDFSEAVLKLSQDIEKFAAKQS